MLQISFKYFSILTLCLWLGKAEKDFENGSDDDLQVMLTEPQKEVESLTPLHKNTYFKELSDCPYTESKIMLSLVLKSTDWDDIVDKKKTRALNKLSKFFAVPKEFIKIESVSRRDISDMSKKSIKRGLYKSDSDKHLGKVEFMIGCGQTYFKIGEPITMQIAQQMIDGSIDDITGLEFGWWVIWKKKIANRVQRFKREEEEGSGQIDPDTEDYEYDYEDGEQSITDIPVETTHAHRHHHGLSKGESEESAIPVATTTTTRNPTVPSTIPNETDVEAGGETTVVALTEPTVPRIVEESPTTTPTPTTTTTQLPVTTTPTTTTTTTTPKPTTTTTEPTTEYIEPEPINSPPLIRNRLPKQPVTAGKPFSFIVPNDTFYDREDGANLKLELYDKNGNTLKSNSWIQFKPETKEIYGLPLEDSVSRWQFRLIAIDSKNATVNDSLDIVVQQHKGHRSVNHEISIQVKLIDKFANNIDWQIRLIRGIVETLGDYSLSNVVVRDIRQNQLDPHTATLVYTNETLSKDKCPEDRLDTLIEQLDANKLTDSLLPEISVKLVSGQPIGPCQKMPVVKPKPTPHMTKNFPPVPRNQVDRVNATINQLLVFKVPDDTFYDPEDHTDLKLSLLTSDRQPLDPRNWLQFDAKNHEFYGIPKHSDYGSEQYLLVAEDREGQTASDALIVVVNAPSRREYNILTKLTLGMPFDNFNQALVQRHLIERIAQLFGDSSTANIQLKAIQNLNSTGSVMVAFFNTTAYRSYQRCPSDDDLEAIRNVWQHPDSTVRERVRKTLGNEFNIQNVHVMPTMCHGPQPTDPPFEVIPKKTEKKKASSFADDYLFTFIVPAVIILVMLLLASIVACVLHRRRLTGKMELGDEEERRSFRSKGIPVIFQDELDEKPEIGNKSPIILKDEKPPLLPPSYNSDNDVDEYVPPPAVIVGGREQRGKSPVTPSYRKPPPYVSP